MVHIAYGIDDKYLPCLIVSMFTTLQKLRNNAEISIFTAGPEFDTQPIYHLVNEFQSASVSVRRFDTGPLATYESTTLSTRFPAASMLPLFLPWLVEGKCIFLDADTLILDDLTKIFNADLNGNLIGAPRSYAASLSIFRAFHRGYFFPLIYKERRRRYEEKAIRLGYSGISDFAEGFFSSGVLVLDANAIRSIDPNRTLSSMENSKEHWINGVILPDMDRLN